MKVDSCFWGIGLLLLPTMAGGCVASEAGNGDETTGTAASAVTASCNSMGPGSPCPDSYFYLMCNSTGFTPDATTQLRPVGAGQYQLTYSVTQDWMVNNDHCRVVETNQLNGWGTQNQGYSLMPVSTLTVPSGSYLGADGSFLVTYPAMGAFTATVTWGNQPGIAIASAAPSTLWEPVLNPAGHITSIGTHPFNRDVVWVAYDNGTVFRTSNATAARPSWSEVDAWSTSAGTQHLPAGTIKDIAVSTAYEDTAILGFAGTKQGSKLWTSGQGGSSWVQVTGFPQDAVGDILGISINPIDNRVYVNGVAGLAVGRSSGSAWEAVSADDPLKPAAAVGAVSSVVTYTWSASESVLFVGTTVGEVFLSFNKGGSWMRIDQERMGSPTRRVIDLAPFTTFMSKPGVYVSYEGMQPNAQGVGDSLWVTPSGGQGWTNIYGNLPLTPAPTNIYSMGAISVNPAAPPVLYLSFTNTSATSTNQGASWALASPW